MPRTVKLEAAAERAFRMLPADTVKPSLLDLMAAMRSMLPGSQYPSNMIAEAILTHARRNRIEIADD